MHKYIFYYFLLLSTIGFAQTSPGVYTIQNLEKNSKVSDFGTSFYNEDKIIFSSSRGGKFDKKWDNGQGFLDLYEGKIESNGQISNVKKLASRVNSEDHESNVSFTPDFKTVYFTGQNIETEEEGKVVKVRDGKPSRRSRGGRTKTEEKKSIYFSIYKADVSSSGTWSNIESLPFNSINYMTGHPSVNKDGTKLYFASTMPGSYGESDIYVVDILEDGTYSRPKNLGAKINSEGRDGFPFIDKNDVLYFSSDIGNEGLGGLDIYAVKIYENTYSEVIHLGNVINTEADDFAFIINNDNNEGYFSSNREGGKGDDDIYHFVADPPIQFGCSQTLTGVITDNNNQNLNGVTIIALKNGTKYSTTKSKSNGSYSIKVPCDSDVLITGTKSGYTANEKEVGVLNENVQANLQLEKQLCLKTIAGVVTDNSFGSLDGVAITIIDSNGKEYKTISKQGRFSTKVPCDVQLKVKGVKEGYVSAEKNATADTNMEAKLPIKLQLEKVACLKIIEGVVTDNSFSTLSGVAITIVDAKGKQYTTTSKSQGKFSMEVPCETTLKIKGIKEGYLDDQRDYTVDNQAKTPLQVKLQLEKIIVCMQSVHLSIENSRTSKPVPYAVVTVYGSDNTAITSKKASDLGQLTFEVPCEKVFTLKASKDKYKDSEMQITTQNGETTQDFVLRMELIPDLTEIKIIKDKVVVNVNPIYFPLNSAKITPTAAVELNKVVAMMQKYPTLKIEGASHTDSRGKSESNMVLSGKRANSTVRYIINQGIDSKRITAQGYGETQPVNGCIDGVKCTNAEYQLNRRTEFVILNPEVLGYY